MAMARVLKDNDFNDLVMRDRIAEIFLFFLPGLSSHLKNMAVSEERFGSTLPVVIFNYLFTSLAIEYIKTIIIDRHKSLG